MLRAGQSTVVTLLDRGALAVWSSAQDRWVVYPGTYRLLVGSSSRDVRATARVTVPG
jgi:beta-glucosidase